MKVSGVRCQVSGIKVVKFSHETSYEIPPNRNSEQLERRTSNVQHRTLNIDDATLYRF